MIFDGSFPPPSNPFYNSVFVAKGDTIILGQLFIKIQQIDSSNLQVLNQNIFLKEDSGKNFYKNDLWN